MAFRWQANDGPIKEVLGSSIPPSTKKNNKNPQQKRLSNLDTPLKKLWIRAWATSSEWSVLKYWLALSAPGPGKSKCTGFKTEFSKMTLNVFSLNYETLILKEKLRNNYKEKSISDGHFCVTKNEKKLTKWYAVTKHNDNFIPILRFAFRYACILIAISTISIVYLHAIPTLSVLLLIVSIYMQTNRPKGIKLFHAQLNWVWNFNCS